MSVPGNERAVSRNESSVLIYLKEVLDAKNRFVAGNGVLFLRGFFLCFGPDRR